MLAPPGHPLLLLGGPQADKEQVGPGGRHLEQHRLLVLEVAVLGAAQGDAGVPLQDAAARLLGHAGLGTQQVEPPAPLIEAGEHILREGDAGDPALQRGALDFCRVYHPDAVGQGQVGPVEHLKELPVLLRRQNELRIGCYHIVEFVLRQQGGPRLGSLLPGKIVKVDA